MTCANLLFVLLFILLIRDFDIGQKKLKLSETM